VLLFGHKPPGLSHRWPGWPLRSTTGRRHPAVPDALGAATAGMYRGLARNSTTHTVSPITRNKTTVERPWIRRGSGARLRRFTTRNKATAPKTADTPRPAPPAHMGATAAIRPRSQGRGNPGEARWEWWRTRSLNKTTVARPWERRRNCNTNAVRWPRNRTTVPGPWIRLSQPECRAAP
jgi:hypothetical protein